MRTRGVECNLLWAIRDSGARRGRSDIVRAIATMDACLGDDTLLDLVEGRAAIDARTRIEAHASRCESCRAMLSALARGSSAPRAPVATKPKLAAGTRLGRYEIMRELGAGGMGVVYLARDPELDRDVAIKLLRGFGGEAARVRLRREAQAMARLAHPNVVAVFDVGEHAGDAFVAMEYLAGDTLARWVAGKSAREILEAYRAVGRGLAAAHAAGIVHRDVKPENVLVGADGRPRVVDFGLAREPGRDAAGSIGGTPHYLAPECYRGAEADARSDQFSFCVALYGALAGTRPFAGDTLAELAAEITAGRIQPPKRTLDRRVHAALRRGLASDPDDRFASIDHLLTALAPAARTGWWLSGGGLAVAIPLALLATRDEPAPACEVMLDPWVQYRAAVHGSVLAHGGPFARETWLELERRLARYASELDAAHSDVCTARASEAQSVSNLELRASCLDERRHALSALVSSIASEHAIEREVVARAVTAAGALPPIADCADLVVLRGPVAPDPRVATRVEELRGQLARLRARRDLGLYATAHPATLAVVEQAGALGYRPLEAEALALAGRLERDRDDFAAAHRALERSVLAAEAGRHDRQTASSLIELMAVVGRGLGKRAEVPALRDRVLAVLERLGRPSDLTLAFRETNGAALRDAGDVPAAEAELRETLAGLGREYGTDDLRLVGALRALAHTQLEGERGSEARGHLERALAIQRRVLGEHHLDVAVTLGMLGGAEIALGNEAGAILHFERARAIAIAATGPDTVAVASITSNLASVIQSQGKLAEAHALHLRAVEIATHRLGARHPTTLVYRSSLAASLADLGKLPESIAMLEGVLADQRLARGPDHQSIAMTLELLANIELAVGRHAAARDHALEAKAMFERTLGEAYNPYAELRVLGEAHLALGDAAAALAALEAAQRHRTDAIDPGTLALTDAMLGRALVQSGRDRARGERLLRSVWPKVVADERLADQRAELAAWARSAGLSLR